MIGLNTFVQHSYFQNNESITNIPMKHWMVTEFPKMPNCFHVFSTFGVIQEHLIKNYTDKNIHYLLSGLFRLIGMMS